MHRYVLAICLIAAAAGFVSPAAVHNPRIVTRALAPIDDLGQFQAEWTANLDTRTISFNLVVETEGWVGFGFSPSGTMEGSDLIIGGVHDNGQSYFADRQGLGHSEPVIDIRQNYELTQVVQNATHTQLSFNRLLDTGDVAQDLEIKDETTSIIWAFGSTDVIEYHRSTRGVHVANLLRP